MCSVRDDVTKMAPVIGRFFTRLRLYDNLYSITLSFRASSLCLCLLHVIVCLWQRMCLYIFDKKMSTTSL